MATKATTSMEGVEKVLAGLGLPTPVPAFAGSDILNKPLDIGRSYLADILRELLPDRDPEEIYKAIQWSNDISAGDLSVPLPKITHDEDSAEDLAWDLMRQFPSDFPLFVLPVPDAIFLRIFFNKSFPTSLVPYIKERGSEYGHITSHGLQDPSSAESRRQKVVIEFSSPNIIEEFKVANLRSTLVGTYIANLYEAMGWEVVRMNYLGDWGNNIGLFAAGWPKFGSEEKINDYRHLADVYSKVAELHDAERAATRKKAKKNKATENGNISPDLEAHGLAVEREDFLRRMESRDTEAIKLWAQALETSLAYYKQLYEQLNVKYDEYVGESKVSQESMTEIEEILKKRGLSEQQPDASWVINLPKYDPKAQVGTLRDRHGSSTYFLRELGAILDRHKQHSFDKMVYVVATFQDSHFRKVMKTMELLDDEFPGLSKKLQQVYVSKTTRAFEPMESGRSLEDFLADTHQSMQESLLANADAVALLGSSSEVVAAMGINALLVEELSTKWVHERKANEHGSELVRVTSFDVGTGPFMQYTYARARKILETESPTGEDGEINGVDLTSLRLNGSAPAPPCPFTELLQLLLQYPDQTSIAYDDGKGLESNTFVGHLQGVANQLAACLDKDAAIKPDQLEVVEVGAQVLRNGMNLLGMKL